MKRILICSIIRNQSNNLINWLNLLNKLKTSCQNEYVFDFSFYENDSTDYTKEILSSISKSPNIRIISENIGTNHYSSIVNINRIINLSRARNKCLENIDLSIYDKIAYIEPDITFDPFWCSELILAKHPASVNISPDIYSAWSLRPVSNPKESFYLYDTWATRQSDSDKCWNFETENNWITKSLIKTDLGEVDSNCLHSLYSTFNCFCVYNAKPFINGIRWNYENLRIDTSNIKTENGWLDADTSILCEDFRKNGYNNILINRNCIVRHN